MALVNVGIFASITLELHIAVGVAALYCRARGPMHLLSRSVWWCWVPGVIAGVLQVAFAECDEDGSTCTRFEIIYTFGAGCLTCFFYLVSGFRALWYPKQQERRAHTMVCVYVASFLITLFRTYFTT